MKIISMAALVAVVLASNVLQSTYAATYTVGDTAGWTVPTGGNTEFYDNWADNKNFLVGDVLVFNFVTGAHNVEEVTEAVYDSCNGTNNPISTHNTGPARITLNRLGEYHFICSVPGHCTAGQKLSVDVRNGPRTAAPTPGSSPNGPGIPGSGPNGSPSSASSLVAAVSLAIMSIALVLLC
ncbi:putative Early nodulin 16 [Hibiscus syriacus]|uniref:Early nodulin 16 n=2 Tax=Hibiscus syriacus TaxID=106335 RepID=A0A6A2XK18_HIBSY|nr:putative Early nodulin 16 [Hibiscus syriacus]